MIIEGRSVLEVEPEFSNPPAIIGHRESTITAISDAPRVAQFPGKYAIHTLNHSWLFTSKAEIEFFQDFFESVGGKWAAFWAPSWTAELNPTAGLLNGGTSLQVTSVDYPNIYLNIVETTKLGAYVFLLHIDGTLHVSRVLNAVTGAGVDTLTLATGVPQAFSLGEFIVGFVYFVRFAADKLALEFDGPEQARTRLAMIQVINVDAPIDPAASPDPGPPVEPEVWTDKDNVPWEDAQGNQWTVN
jgi:hypothetical protein